MYKKAPKGHQAKRNKEKKCSFLCVSFVGANSPVLAQGLHQASSHLQQLQAHLLRTSPYLSPQNSFIHAASYLPPPVALFGAASTSGKDCLK